MLSPFLTDVDSRAQIKGSRDPLGIQSIWTALGRHVVANLTTVSSSIRDFTTHLLGFYFLERARALGGGHSDLELFLKWEQLAAYARAWVNKDLVFRGTERVQKNLADSRKITLSADRAAQILTNQKTYGLWGLYTVPARVSGMVDADPPRLTPESLEFVERTYLPWFAAEGLRDGNAILDLLRKDRVTRLDVAGRDARFMQAVARFLKLRITSSEREFYRDHLLYGGPRDETHGLQAHLVGLIEKTLSNKDFVFSPRVVGQLAREAARKKEGETLASRLDRIRACETLMAPASMLFSYLLAQNGRPIDTVAKTIREQWGKVASTVDASGIAALRNELVSITEAKTADRWINVAAVLSGGDYAGAIRLLLAQNAATMSQRGGAPWISQQRGRLEVKFRDETGSLPAKGELADLWRFPYFLDSLRAVALQLRDA